MVSVPINKMFYLGIDGGGSKCRASVADAEGNIIGTGVAGPANPLHGVEQTLESIGDAAKSALSEAGLPDSTLSTLVAGVGLAGVNLPSLYDVVNRWQHPFAAMHLTTDLHIACLGAHNWDDGAVIITGTGSCGYASVGGKGHVLGGYGFPYGDQASGAWMGLEAIKAVLLAFDDLGPQTQLSDAIADQLQARGVMIVERMAKATSRDFARLAPLVLAAAESGDAVARRIVEEGAAYVSALGRKLLALGPPRLSMLGGLADRLRPWLDAEVAQQVSPPLGPPEAGAIYYARQQHQLAQPA